MLQPADKLQIRNIQGDTSQVGEGNIQHNHAGGKGDDARVDQHFHNAPQLLPLSRRNSLEFQKKLLAMEEKTQYEKDKFVLEELRQLFVKERGLERSEITSILDTYNTVLGNSEAFLSHNGKVHELFVNYEPVDSKDVLKKITEIIKSMSPAVELGAPSPKTPTTVEKRRPSGIKTFAKKNEIENTLDALRELKRFFLEQRDEGEESPNIREYDKYLKIANSDAYLIYRQKDGKHILNINGNELDYKSAVQAISEMIKRLEPEQKNTSEHAQYLAIRSSGEESLESKHSAERLIEETQELMKDIAQLDISSEKSVLLMGQTGVGKSTLMNLLAGLKLRGVESKRGSIRIENIDELTGFKIGHKKASETTIPCKWANIDGDQASYWDCPGFLENRGEAQEIANASFIKRLFDASRETKILIIIPYNDISETRASKILPLVAQIDSMFSGNFSKIKRSISLIVSKAPENRTASHVKESINDIIQDIKLNDSKRSILETLRDNPINILKAPTREGDIDPNGLVRAELLKNISRMEYANGLCVNISLSDHAKLTATSSYRNLHEIIQGHTQSFISDFRKIVRDFSSQCVNKDELSSIVLKLKEIEKIPADSEKEEKLKQEEVNRILLNLENSFDKKINLSNIAEGLKLSETTIYLEEFIDKSSHIPLKIISGIRTEFQESIKTLEESIANIEKEEQHAREIKAAEDARIAAEEKAKEEARIAEEEKAKAARIAEETRIANIEKEEQHAREMKAAEEKARKAEEATRKREEEQARKMEELTKEAGAARKRGEEQARQIEEIRKEAEAVRKEAEAARKEAERIKEEARKREDEQARKELERIKEEARKRDEEQARKIEELTKEAGAAIKREEAARKEAERIKEEARKAEAKAKEEARKVDPKELNQFLNFVAEGDQGQAEGILQHNRNLALEPAYFTDNFGRSFNGITGFQYAVWALDWHMWTMIRRYLPDDAAREQAQGFETGAWVRDHGVCANLNNLIRAYQTTISLYKAGKYVEANTAWVRQVGGAQIFLPEHVIDEYCHPDRSFYPVPNFEDAALLPRRLSPDYAGYSATELGSSFALVRARRNNCALAWAGLSCGDGRQPPPPSRTLSSGFATRRRPPIQRQFPTSVRPPNAPSRMLPTVVAAQAIQEIEMDCNGILALARTRIAQREVLMAELRPRNIQRTVAYS